MSVGAVPAGGRQLDGRSADFTPGDFTDGSDTKGARAHTHRGFGGFTAGSDTKSTAGDITAGGRRVEGRDGVSAAGRRVEGLGFTPGDFSSGGFTAGDPSARVNPPVRPIPGSPDKQAARAGGVSPSHEQAARAGGPNLGDHIGRDGGGDDVTPRGFGAPGFTPGVFTPGSFTPAGFTAGGFLGGFTPGHFTVGGLFPGFGGAVNGQDGSHGASQTDQNSAIGEPELAPARLQSGGAPAASTTSTLSANKHTTEVGLK